MCQTTINTNVSVPCVVVALLAKEYRSLPRDGVGSKQELQFVTFRPEKGLPFVTVQSGTGQKRWASTADAHNANPLREEDEKTM